MEGHSSQVGDKADLVQNEQPPDYSEYGIQPTGQQTNYTGQAAYGDAYNYGGHIHGVVTTQPQTVVGVIQRPSDPPSDYLGLAIFTTLCCNLICGIIAILLAVNSRTDRQAGRYEEARSNGKAALYLSIAGIVTGLCAIGYVIYYMSVVYTWPKACTGEYC